LIPLFKVAMSGSAAADVGQVLASGYIGQGPKVEEFERELAERVGNPRVVSVNSATSGLHLALHLGGWTSIRRH
jgi:dTDP-4-amino-4,6-dideoxygalactose transaminase